MLLRQSLLDKRIIACIYESYDIRIHTLVLLPLGADMNSCVYKAEALDNSAFFVKLRHGHTHQISIAILDLLNNANLPFIIPPVRTKDSKGFEYIDDFVLSLHPFIDGQNGFNQPLTDDQWVSLGHALRQVHEIKVPSSIQQQIRRENYSPKWRQIVQSLLNQIDDLPAGDDIAQKLFAFIVINQQSIQELVKRADELAEKLKNTDPVFVLCHSDIHAGNVLIDNSGNMFIVDWDDPIMAPKERDLMFIGGGIGNVWNEKMEEKLFYNGYGDVKINKTILAYYRYERIIEDIAIYAEQLLLTSIGGENRSVMYKHFIDMFEPRGVVDIAFTT